MTNSRSPRDSRIRFPLDGGVAVIVGITLVAIATLVWGFQVRENLREARSALEATRLELDEVRANANATAYSLLPAADAPPHANGTAFFALDGTGVITVANLEPAPAGRAYQVWYYPSDEAEPLPGASFTVDNTGVGFMLIPADVGLFTRITVTLEPEIGSPTPSGPVILAGATGGARG